jgi:hypothetical protein
VVVDGKGRYCFFAQTGLKGSCDTRSAGGQVKRWRARASLICAIARRRPCQAGKSSGWRWRARVLRPKLLLLDEPTANLDGPAREAVIALIPTLMHAGSSVVMAVLTSIRLGGPTAKVEAPG